MADPTYSLAWPRELFVWEANRILKMSSDHDVQKAIVPLLEEAFEDASVARSSGFDQGAWGVWSEGGIPMGARDWLLALLADESKLLPYVEPVYWAERHGLTNDQTEPLWLSFAQDVLALLYDMQDKGYFPRALPRDCVDDGTDNVEVARLIRKATKLALTWPVEDPETLSEGAVYSLIEYFNDQAQRPRTYTVHGFSGCGPHYDNHNRESGGVVYRWRMNEVLRAHSVDLRLGSTPPERGRLIRHFDSPLDDLADEEIAERGADPDDEVAHAIRDYRQRGATLPQKRAALALLAGALEPRRGAIGERLTKKDESDLFQIANTFAIRHRGDSQRTDYGDEFLDWVFWNYLATVQLMEALEERN